jgi:hypothetical protein
MMRLMVTPLVGISGANGSQSAGMAPIGVAGAALGVGAKKAGAGAGGGGAKNAGAAAGGGGDEARVWGLPNRSPNGSLAMV